MLYFVSVYYPEGRNEECRDSGHMQTHNPDGYISSTSSISSNKKTASCLWLITALPGQTINITVIDFHPKHNQPTCQPLGFVKDLNNDNEVTICKNEKRKQHLYQSSGSRVEIKLDPVVADSNYLLHYEGKCSSYKDNDKIKHVIMCGIYTADAYTRRVLAL